jgi:hypothetical protein
MNTVTETAGPFLKQQIEPIAVLVCQENILPPIAAKDNMVEPTWVMYAWFACHAKIIAESINLSTWKPDPIGFS